MRTSRKHVAVILGLLLLLGTQPATAGSPEGDTPADPVPLAGTVTLEGKESGFVPVHLPRPAAVSLDWKDGRAGGFEHLEVEGDGRLQGFWLVDDPVERTAELLVLRKAPARGTFGDERTMAFSRVETDDGVAACGSNCDVNLPAGDYRLYLIADDGPTTVTVRLFGLGGEVDLAPAQPVNAPQVWLEAPGLLGHGEAWRDRDTATLDAAGAIFTMQWRIQPPSEPASGVFLPRASTSGACRWEGGPPPVDATAPGCPGGEGHAFQLGGGTAGANASATRFRSLSLNYDFAPGPITLGAWAAAATTDAHVGLTAVYVPYESDPAAADTDHQTAASDDGVVLETTGYQQEEILVLR